MIISQVIRSKDILFDLKIHLHALVFLLSGIRYPSGVGKRGEGGRGVEEGTTY
jgi:hypothetical protein